jgi:hypothetical protein
MCTFNLCCVSHGDTAARNFLIHEDDEQTTACIIDLGRAAPACSAAYATGDLADVDNLFEEWGLAFQRRAEVADGLRFKIPGLNWNPPPPNPARDEAVLSRM